MARSSIVGFAAKAYTTEPPAKSAMLIHRKKSIVPSNNGDRMLSSDTRQLSLFDTGRNTECRGEHGSGEPIASGRNIVLIDDDSQRRDKLLLTLADAGFTVHAYERPSRFLNSYSPHIHCVLADIRMPEMDGPAFLNVMRRKKQSVPTILISDGNSVTLAVRAMKAGATDVVERPVIEDELISSISDIILTEARQQKQAANTWSRCTAIALLTPRERHVLEQITQGRPNKVAAHQLGISTRTVEFHRARIMEKLNAKNISDLIHISIAMK